MSAPSLSAVYRGYDDAALALLSNPGLVRRAGKLVAAGGIAVDGSDVTVGDVVVRLAPAGPAAARCPCPGTGVCVHILAASMWMRQAGAESPGGESPGSETAVVPVADPLATLLATDPLALCREGGIAVVRRAKAYLESLDASLNEVTTVVDQSRLAISVGERQTPIYYVDGAGLAGMVSDAESSERLVVHLAALVRVFRANGRDWAWPTAATDAEGASFASVHGDTIELLTATLSSLITAGLSHVGTESAERLSAIAVRARAEGLPLLARTTTSAAGLLSELADRRDESTEREVAVALAQVWALAAALSASTPDRIAPLVGTVRRDFSGVTTIDLLPLGALWWMSSTGARGISLAVADRATGTIELVTTARPAGTDPGFRKSADASLVWSSSLQHLAAGPFRLEKARRSDDGSLSASGGEARVVRDAGVDFDRDELRRVAVNSWEGIGGAGGGFGAPSTVAVLLAPGAVGDIRIDEAAQQLVWPLVDSDGDVLEARVDVSPESTARIEALIALSAARTPVEFVLVQLGRRGGHRTIEPTGVFVREKSGLSLIVPDFVRPQPERAATKGQALRARFDRMLHSPRPALVTTASLTLAERICLPVLDVLEEVCATGRLTLTERQRGILNRQATLASDIALATVEAAVRTLLTSGPVSVPAVYRCLFVVDRALGVTA